MPAPASPLAVGVSRGIWTRGSDARGGERLLQGWGRVARASCGRGPDENEAMGRPYGKATRGRAALCGHHVCPCVALTALALPVRGTHGARSSTRTLAETALRARRRRRDTADDARQRVTRSFTSSLGACPGGLER
ncbi:unnamed protein product [Lampetra planeri]